MKPGRADNLLLQDILDAIEVVNNYLPADRANFDSNPMLQSHIYRHLMIIGEATYRLSKLLKNQNPHVPWNKIEGMRHILVHDYFKVNWTRVYETARDAVPVLKSQIQNILASIKTNEK